jgi:uncharacterized protein (TIGR00369 family)
MEATEAEYRAFYDELARDRKHPPIHDRMGVNLLQLAPSTVMTMELTEEVRGAAEGSVHGGILATFADITSAVALWSSFDRNTEIPVTTDMHVRYYRQPSGGPLTAEATVVHRGRRLLSTECSVVDAQERVLCRSTATYMIVLLPERAAWREPAPPG